MSSSGLNFKGMLDDLVGTRGAYILDKEFNILVNYLKDEKISQEVAFERAEEPLRKFMFEQTREKDCSFTQLAFSQYKITWEFSSFRSKTTPPRVRFRNIF